mmetsp:Transcript_35551/g.36230  ORF Transcript_35551/g.36230 Transcript_35551/m.36230 type:complete len:127 (+) Transcript_35551:122-502(+)|eukprot:CAMPEP_0182427264 /NCGR_PEP_ID=MMETSP1167-20130531/16554_1 /TAXON_ID=2988 /ORGANISM="Mallomonas Sp, Strain CCMP3275" /LENGTH=126 /DNA_ID=CAMNT_0024609385 /DNA_START=108 /DNA_END=488 /DNA_ORIENTATION=+
MADEPATVEGENTDEVKNSNFEDKTLACKDCGADWVFSAGEQEFYNEKGFENEPGRCKDCRRKKKDARVRRSRGRGRGRGGGDRGERKHGEGGKTSGNVCYAFQRGECTRGEGCRFAHVEASGEEA